MLICYLARQIPLRGDGNEKESNFYQLLALHSEDVSSINLILEKNIKLRRQKFQIKY